ncbi:MAG: hypothetical protein J6K81_03395 [Rikenellaceae bacterium]|nr:hypothetical protein [Rikenellaceae bacterium]
MKKILLIVLAAMPLVCSAQFKYKEVKDNQLYRSCIYKEANKVYCEMGFLTHGKTEAQVLAVVEEQLGEGGKMLREPAKYTLVGKSDDMIIYQISDELIFHRNFISSDVAQMSGRLVIKVGNSAGVVRLDNIVYRIGTVDEQITGMPHEKWKSGYSVSDSGVEIVPAEELIADDVALTKKGELVRSLAKYRVKTIDYVSNIVETLHKQLK